MDALAVNDARLIPLHRELSQLVESGISELSLGLNIGGKLFSLQFNPDVSSPGVSDTQVHCLSGTHSSPSRR